MIASAGLRDGTYTIGFRPDPHAPDELERALEAVLTDPSLRTTLGARASVKANALTWTTAARRLLDTVEELAGSNL